MTARIGIGGHKVDAVLDAGGLLELRAACVHTALGEAGVAACYRHLLQKQHFCALIDRTHGRSHACAACAYHDDVVLSAVDGVLRSFRLKGSRSAAARQAHRHRPHAEGQRARKEAATGNIVAFDVHNRSPSLFLLAIRDAIPALGHILGSLVMALRAGDDGLAVHLVAVAAVGDAMLAEVVRIPSHPLGLLL